MWPFHRHPEEKELTPGSLFDLMDSTTRFVGALRAGGGFSYVLFGSGLLLVVCTLFLGVRIAEPLLHTIRPLGMALLAVGTLVAIIDRFIAYKIAMLKLRMIVDVTQRVVVRAVEADRPPDSAVIRSLITESLAGVWGLWIPPEQGLLKGEPTKR